ncbi:MAG: hypothetical protein ACJA0Y_000560 [Maricaulis maris]|jgi:hypothetical protein
MTKDSEGADLKHAPDTDGFERVSGQLFWRGSDGSLIGPLNPASPTGGDNQDGEGIPW